IFHRFNTGITRIKEIKPDARKIPEDAPRAKMHLESDKTIIGRGAAPSAHVMLSGGEENRAGMKYLILRFNDPDILMTGKEHRRLAAPEGGPSALRRKKKRLAQPEARKTESRKGQIEIYPVSVRHKRRVRDGNGAQGPKIQPQTVQIPHSAPADE